MLWAAYGEGHLGKELRTAFGWEPARNWGPQSSSLQEWKAANKHVRLEADVTAALADTSIAAF